MAFGKKTIAKQLLFSSKTLLMATVKRDEREQHASGNRAILIKDLLHEMDSYKTLHTLLSCNPTLKSLTSKVQRWQRSRISESYKQVFSDPNTRSAAIFLLKEAYSGPNLDAILRDSERAARKMSDIIPEDFLQLACKIAQLNRVTLSLDIDIALGILQQHTEARPAICDNDLLSTKLYEHIYANENMLPTRQTQLALMEALGEQLPTLRHHPWIPRFLKTVRKPAKLLGASALIDFAETALNTLNNLPEPANHLVSELVAKERQYLRRLSQGERGLLFT